MAPFGHSHWNERTAAAPPRSSRRLDCVKSNHGEALIAKIASRPASRSGT